MNKIFQDVFLFSKQHLYSILTLTFLYVLLTVFLNFGLNYTGLDLGLISALSFLIHLTLRPFYISIIIKYIGNAVDNTSNRLAIDLAEWRHLFLLYAIYVALVLIGFSLLILPGIIIGIRLSLAEIYLLRHKLTVRESLKASWQATTPYFGKLLAGSLLISLVFLLLELFFAVGAEAQGFVRLFSMFMRNLVTMIGVIIITVFYYRVFSLINTEESKQDLDK